ncbi:MAG: cbb3-type cytochrome c oxidase N-terminal domain-containing protein [Bacteroidota bacterium]
MKNRIPVYITIPLVLITIAVVIALMLDTEKYPGFWESPYLWMFMFVVALLLLAIDAVNKSLDAIKLHNMSAEERAEVLKGKRTGWKALMNSLTDAKPIEHEKDVLLDHDYDGIQELDNELPPWWVWLFYITIFFAFAYIIRFYVMDGPNQTEEYEIEMAEAKAEVEEYLKNTPDLVSLENVEMLTDAASMDEGNKIFQANCAACHTADGGGMIGPNLTDEYWILGGGIKDVFKTISNGGRPGKGMIAWSASLRPTQIQQVSSFVLSLKGTTPQNPKAPEGDKWEE